MKLQAIILVAAILLGIMAPPVLAGASVRDDAPAIGTLDLCSHAAPALSAGGEMPCVHTTPCNYQPMQFVLATVSDKAFSIPFALSSENEHPPRS